MRTLVIYYSFEGNTRFIAEHIANAVGGDLLELKPREELSSKGFMKYVWGGRQVVTRATPELVPLDRNPAGYDLIFIGTPVWAFTFAPALRTFLQSDAAKFKGKRVAFFCCCGGTKGRTFGNLRAAFEGNIVLGEITFVEPLRTSSEAHAKTAEAWAREMAGKT